MTSAHELDNFEEVVGNFKNYQVEETRVVVTFEEGEISIPLSGLRTLSSARLKSGDQVSMLRTDDDEHPIRVRRL
jgi:hypothetical protein